MDYLKNGKSVKVTEEKIVFVFQKCSNKMHYCGRDAGKTESRSLQFYCYTL